MKRMLGAWPRKTAFALLIGAWSGSVRVEVTLDGSLGGPSGSLPGPDFQIDANMGRQAGSNLFHSFGVFNVNTGESATFNDAGASGLVENILSRVTGGSVSNIDGMLATDFANTTPNLFLLNPAGVVFGPHASLDVQGSFHVSTADFIELADGVRFDALPSPNDALLSVAAPAAFGFLSEHPTSIAFHGNGTGTEKGFAVPEGETLSVVGGDVEVQSAAMLKAPGGRINMASLASRGEVKLGDAALEAESSGPLGTITMQGSTLDVSERQGGTTGGGSVFIRGAQFVVDHSDVLANTVNGNSEGIDIDLTEALRATNESSFEARTLGPGNAGNVTINANEEVVLADGSRVNSGARVRAGEFFILGNAGSIVINTGRLELNRGGNITALTSSNGRAGDVKITAKEIVLKGRSDIGGRSALSATTDTGRGAGGDITINTDRLSLADSATIRALSNGPGKGGNITIEANDIVLEGGSELRTEANGKARFCGQDCGDAGNVSIKTVRLQVTGGSQIEAGTQGPGNAGNVTINATEAVLFADDSKVLSQARLGEPGRLRILGDAGRIVINTGRLELSRGPDIVVLTSGDGNGGVINITAKEVLLKGIGNVGEGRSTLSATTDTGRGAGGDITINTDRLSLADGATMRALSNGPGKGGNITIEANDIVLEGSSDLLAGVEKFGSGPGGKIEITAGNIELREGSRISSESRSALPNAGHSGEIVVRAKDSLRLFNDSRISVQTAQANAGDINLDVGFLLHLRDGSSITTSVAGGQGDGGNITIDPVFTVLDGGSSSIARARQGRGGDIRIVSDFFFKSPDSVVSASSELGIDGVVEIDSPDTDVISSALELPESFFDVATLLTQGCARGAELSRLVVRKYEVLPDSPAALRVPPPGGLLGADAPNEGVTFTHEPLGPGFEHSSACGSDG